MKIRTPAATCAFCFVILAGTAAHGQGGRGKVADPDAKRAVILLGKTQFLGDAAAFPAFAKKHAAAKRSKLRDDTVKELKAIAKKEQAAMLEALGSPEDARSLWIVNALALRLTAAEIEKARALPMIKFVYPGLALPDESKAAAKVSEVLEPGDPARPFSTRGKDVPWNLKGLGVTKVWKKHKVYGAGVVVAMFDQGINYAHEDIRQNMWVNPGEIANNGKDDDGNGLVDDLYGYHFSAWSPEIKTGGRRQHGTLTSSVVAGDGTGGKITGVAPRAKLMGLIGFGGPYTAARCFQYAIENGADIVNMSFSIPDLGHTRGLWRLMAEQATCSGLVLISGSGNFRRNAKVPVQIRIPEGIPCVICIGGVTKKKKLAQFSSCGPVEWSKVKFYEDHPMPKGLIKPDVVAFPGPRIGLVTANGDKGYLGENNGRQGNSLSAPHVAGICALMLSVNPELTSWRVKEILEDTAKDIAPRGKDNETGAGLVNALKAVAAAKEAAR